MEPYTISWPICHPYHKSQNHSALVYYQVYGPNQDQFLLFINTQRFFNLKKYLNVKNIGKLCNLPDFLESRANVLFIFRVPAKLVFFICFFVDVALVLEPPRLCLLVVELIGRFLLGSGFARAVPGRMLPGEAKSS